MISSVTAFQSPASLGCSKRYLSNAAYGRTTFRHSPGDIKSWRMTTSSPDEQSTASTTASSDDVLPNLEQYQNKNNIDDQVFSAMSADGGLKVTVATIRNLLNEMMM